MLLITEIHDLPLCDGEVLAPPRTGTETCNFMRTARPEVYGFLLALRNFAFDDVGVVIFFTPKRSAEFSKGGGHTLNVSS